jgi:hypothetical protein
MKVTFFATWMSASSTENIEEGEVDRDLVVGLGFGETYTDGCKNILDASWGGESGDGSSNTSCSSGSNT